MATPTPLWDLLEPFEEKSVSAKPLSVAEVTRDAEEVLASARREAEAIRSAAQLEIEVTINDATEQADAMREAAWQEGFHNGQAAAREAIEAEYLKRWETTKETMRAELQAFVDDIGVARAALWERQENEMLLLVMEIARQVIKTEIQQNPTVIHELIKNALRRVTSRENIRIRLSVDDAARMRAEREDLIAVIDGVRNLEIVDDRRMGDGGCVIETDAGTIDAKIETQLAEVARAMGIEEE